MRKIPINALRFALSQMSFPMVDTPLSSCELPSAAERYHCIDCGVDTTKIREYFMVEDHLWAEHVPEHHGFLCIGCLEHRMGRMLRATDFPPHLPVNNPEGLFFPHSERLRTRLTDADAEAGGADGITQTD